MEKYGQLPQPIGEFKATPNEMMFYQYLPIKMNTGRNIFLEPRLKCFEEIILAACADFATCFGPEALTKHYVYLTAKYMYQSPNTHFNRTGYHSDGFMTPDINYIWSDRFPTIFNHSDFNLTPDDSISMAEMETQANPENEYVFSDNALLRLNQYCIHKVNDNCEGGMRAFVKVSFSKDRYNLIGNAHNYLIDYSWIMQPRKESRNIPQVITNGNTGK